MKVLSIFFSGTGATETFQKIVQHNCKNYQITFEEFDINKKENIIANYNLGEYDLFLIGGPIYYTNYPQKLVDFIKEYFWESKINQRVVLYTLSAEHTPISVKNIARVLYDKGYLISGVVNVKGLNNFSFSGSEYTKKINSREEVIDDYNKKSRYMKELLVLASRGAGGNNIKIVNKDKIANYRRRISCYVKRNHFISKNSKIYFNTNDLCASCRVCEKNCPNNNIKMYSGTPSFGNDCCSCVRCINNCTKNAITYNGKSIEQIVPITFEEVIGFNETYSE